MPPEMGKRMVGKGKECETTQLRKSSTQNNLVFNSIEVNVDGDRRRRSGGAESGRWRRKGSRFEGGCGGVGRGRRWFCLAKPLNSSPEVAGDAISRRRRVSTVVHDSSERVAVSGLCRVKERNGDGSIGVRKGGWIEEEDCLLKKCVEKHGEGNWHQVPRKAGQVLFFSIFREREEGRWRLLDGTKYRRSSFGTQDNAVLAGTAACCPSRDNSPPPSLFCRCMYKDYAQIRKEMDMLQVPLGVRKGAWTEEEDCLLKKCVEKHGEGNWHQVPRKADKTQTKENSSEPFQIPSPGDDDGILWWDNMLCDPDINRGKITWTDEEAIMEGGGKKEKSGMQGAGKDTFSCVQEDQSGGSDFLMNNMDLWDILGADLK
ncbi:hypothetical protein RHMOL_Rhmol08G0100500 [Rhododendron molle]|uniref:Uncharacterized protein n=1 Tax=Rhododendron molle TaxID=49168 RepID=A0ACC0MNT3_RHOML|nr:hypothetical protein RHMOL_Rhmol08G0100500 [Rhododendron molle]